MAVARSRSTDGWGPWISTAGISGSITVMSRKLAEERRDALPRNGLVPGARIHSPRSGAERRLGLVLRHVEPQKRAEVDQQSGVEVLEAVGERGMRLCSLVPEPPEMRRPLGLGFRFEDLLGVPPDDGCKAVADHRPGAVGTVYELEKPRRRAKFRAPIPPARQAARHHVRKSGRVFVPRRSRPQAREACSIASV